MADKQEGSVYGFQVDLSKGTLTQLAGSPFKADVGNPTPGCTTGCSAELVSDPLGRFLYYDYYYAGSNGVTVLSVDPTTGAVTTDSKYTQPVYELSADPTGHYLYWNGGNGAQTAIGGLAVSGTGQLSPTPGQPYQYGYQESYGNPAVTGKYVLAIEYMGAGATTGSLFEWTVDPATGTLTRTGNTMPVDKGGSPAVTPDGNFIYEEEAYLNNGVYYWQIVPVQVASDGGFVKLSQFAQQTPLQGTSPMFISPDGNFLYISVYGNIWLFQINKTTGALTLVHKYTDIMANVLAIDPTGKFLFASPEGPNQAAGTTLTSYSIDATTGELTPVANSTVDIQATPIGLAVVRPK